MESSRHKRPACARCRHMKLKCDAGDRFPAGCTRCSKAKKTCSIEPGYKAPSKDDRLEELEKEVQMLRADLAKRRSRSPLLAVNDDSSPWSYADSFEASSNEPGLEEASQIHLVGPQHLDGIDVFPPEFSELIDIFFSALHPNFPLFPNKAYLVHESASCPVLFWAVVGVASKASATHLHLYRQLVNPIRRLVMSTAYSTDKPLQVLQALILLCVWPLPFGSNADDPSWMYSGIITHKALRLGLHRLASKHEFEGLVPNKDTDRLRRNTWAACFIVNHLLSQRQGVPPTVRMDAVLYRFMSEPGEAFHSSLRRLLQIVHKDYAFTLALGHNEGTIDGLLHDPLPIVRAYETELNSLERQLESYWTPSLESAFLASKLKLYTYALMRTSDREGGEPSRVQRMAAYSSADVSTYLARAYSASMRIIELAATEGHEGHEPFTEWSVWTVFDLGHLIFATVFLLQITRNWGMQSDTVGTDNAIRQAWALIKSCVVAENDIFSRVCAVIEYVSHGRIDAVPLQTPDALPECLVKGRMSMNLFFDLVFRARKMFKEGRVPARDALPEVVVSVLHSPPRSDVGQERDMADFPPLSMSPLDPKFFWTDMHALNQQPMPYGQGGHGGVVHYTQLGDSPHG